MRAVRLHGQGLNTLAVEEVETPRPASGKALVEVCAAVLGLDSEQVSVRVCFGVRL